jgi:hypothetical protein
MFVAISLLLATACLLTSAGKLLGHPKMRQSAAHFGIPWRKYRLIGAAPRRGDHPPAGSRQREGNGTGPAGACDHARLPGHLSHRLRVARLAASRLARAAPS